MLATSPCAGEATMKRTLVTAVAVAGLAALLGADQMLVGHWQEMSARALRTQSVLAQARMAEALARRQYAVEAVGSYVFSPASAAARSFAAIAAPLAKSDRATGILLYAAADGAVAAHHPPTVSGGQLTAGTNIFKHKTVGPWAEEAVRLRATVVRCSSSPYKDGAVDLAVIAPVFAGDRLQGLAAGVFDLQQISGEAYPVSDAQPFELGLTDEKGNRLIGPARFAAAPDAGEVHVAGNQWRVALGWRRPPGGPPRAARVLIWALGLALIVATLVIVHTAWRRQDWLEEAVAERTAELQFTTEVLQVEITERVEAEQALHESEERLRSALESGHDVYCRMDVDGVITMISPSVKRVLGYTPEELIGRRYAELVVASPQTMELLGHPDYSQQITEHEVEVLRKDGTALVMLVLSRPLRSSSGDVIGRENTARDMSAYKQAEQAVTAAERRHRSTLDALSAALCVVDPDLIVTVCNRAFTRLLERIGSSDEPVGAPLPHLLPFIAEGAWADWRAAMSGDAEATEAPSMQEQIDLPDATASLEVRRVPVFEEGRATGMVVLLDNVTDREPALIVSAPSETPEPPPPDRVRDVEFRVDVDGLITMVGPTALEVCGYEPDEMIGEPMARCFVETGAFRELADLLAREETLTDYEVLLKRADGSHFQALMDIEVLHDEDGAACGAEGSLRDITEHIGADAVVSEGESVLGVVFEAADDGVFIKDATGLFVHANPAMGLLMGMAPEEMIGRSAADLTGAQFAEDEDDADRRVLAGESVAQQMRLPAEDRERFVHVVRFPLRDGAGRVWGIGGIARDLTWTRLHSGAVERRDAIVRAVARTSEELLTGGRWEEAAEGVLEALGEATGAQRVRLLRKRVQDAMTGDSAATLTPVAEWPTGGQAAGAALDVVVPAAEARVLAEGEALCDPSVDADGPGTIARLPLMVDDYWWGVLECLRHAETGWSEPELAALQSGANILAAGIRQQQTALGLMASEELFRSVFDGLVDVYYRTDADGVIMLTSPSIERVLGHAQEDVFGHRVSELWAGGLEDAALRGRLTEDGEVTDFPMTAVHSNGRHVPVSVTARLLRDTDGKLLGAEGLIRDMTERARADAEMRASEERLRALLNATTEMVGLLDPEGRILAANTRLAAIDGTPPEEALNRPLYDGMPEALGQKYKDYVDAVVRGGKPARFTDQWGEIWFDASLYPVLDAEGAVAGVAVYSRDITEQRQAEAALATHLEFVRTLLDRIPNPVFFKSPEGVYMGCNAAFADAVLGLPKEEIVGKSVAELEPHIPADLARAYIEHDDGLQEAGGIQLYEAEAQVADGTRRDFLFSQAAFMDNAGNVAGVVGLMLDITERKRSEQNLSRRQRMEAVGALAAGVAHEFNNILQAVLGRARLMLSDEDTAAAARTDLQQMVDVGERGAELVRRLLEFSRREEPRRRPISLAPVVEDIAAILQQTIAKRAQVVVSIADDLHAVDADARQIEQVLLNLGINAAEAIPDSGTITILAQNQSLPTEHVLGDTSVPPGEYVLIVVADTGTGIDPAVAPHVFEPFYTTKGLASHSGLGLAAAHGIIEAHGGYIGFTSTEEEGTAFEVYLPVETDADADSRAPGEGEKAGENGGTAPHTGLPEAGPRPGGILVVDDEPAVARLACDILEHLGYACMRALDEQAAFEMLASHSEELGVAVIDLELASPGGEELVARLRETDHDLRIVGMLSADGDPELAERMAPHLSGLLRKPFGVGEIAEAVGNALQD